MIVITGGAGFIGSNLVAALEERGHHSLAVIDRLGSDDKWRNLAKRELAAMVSIDKTWDFLGEAPRKVEAVFHMGASSSTTERDADFVLQNNFALSQRYWRWCTEHRVPFIYASSAATYGDGAAGFEDDGSIEGLGKLQPLNAYGWSKHLFDRWVAREVAAGNPVPPYWAGLKFFNVYGPNEYHKGGQQSVVAHLFPRAARGEAARLFRSYRPDYADGGQLRDFVSVEDVVAIMVWLYEARPACGLFNAGTGSARSFADLARAVYSALGRNAEIDYIDMPEGLRSNYQYFTEARMDRLAALGYPGRPTPLEEGVGRYVRDFLAAPDRYR